MLLQKQKANFRGQRKMHQSITPLVLTDSLVVERAYGMIGLNFLVGCAEENFPVKACRIAGMFFCAPCSLVSSRFSVRNTPKPPGQAFLVLCLELDIFCLELDIFRPDLGIDVRGSCVQRGGDGTIALDVNHSSQEQLNQFKLRPANRKQFRQNTKCMLPIHCMLCSSGRLTCASQWRSERLQPSLKTFETRTGVQFYICALTPYFTHKARANSRS